MIRDIAQDYSEGKKFKDSLKSRGMSSFKKVMRGGRRKKSYKSRNPKKGKNIDQKKMIVRKTCLKPDIFT